MTLTNLQSEALLFHLEHIARLPELRRLERFAHVDDETTRMILEQAAGFAADTLAPLAASGDVAGCTLNNGGVTLPAGTTAAYREWCELGFPALGLPPENEGLGFPLAVQSAVQELCDGANLAFGMIGINLRCAALALLKNAAPELSSRWVPGLISGKVASTIVISEPQAGSDVGRILTAAQQRADGSWTLTGSKIWISYGDHDATDQILHLVLARVPNGEAGTRGLGLFAVPKRLESGAANGISVLRLEHKMGLHASPTCVLDFKDAHGWLIGEAGRGLQALFVMMNGMRLAVAVQGAAVANVATLHAVQYARERPQGGNALAKPSRISEHADVRRMLLEMTAQSELLRALALRTAAFLDRGTADEAQGAGWLALGELLLPVAKTLNAETAFVIASQGIQVLGGYGYTNDYPLERLARDIRVASIYEGTSGIQALDFLKRKVLADKGHTLKRLMALITDELKLSTTPLAAPAGEVMELLAQTVNRMTAMTGVAAEDGAYALLQLTGCVVHAWNGHTLYAAATGATDYEQRLRAALELHAAGLADTARVWAGKAQHSLPPYRFPAN